MVKFWRIMLRRRLRFWWRFFCSEARLTFLDRAVQVQMLVVPAGFAVLYETAGAGSLVEELSVLVAALIGLAIVAPILLFVCAIRAVVLARNEERKTGIIHGNTYILHEPQHVHTFVAERSDSSDEYEEEVFKEFVVKPAEPNAFVYLTAESSNNTVRVCLQSLSGHLPNGLLEGMWRAKASTGVRLDRDRKAGISVLIPRNSTSSTIRVWITSLGDGIGPR